ncbi:hypothetical protein B0H34DRAFT_390187 [Crassisporium funariophilum]|nr:hypothetical protein B0H34DRAFT_390187 [Crassisporium funariophilum]
MGRAGIGMGRRGGAGSMCVLRGTALVWSCVRPYPSSLRLQSGVLLSFHPSLLLPRSLMSAPAHPSCMSVTSILSSSSSLPLLFLFFSTSSCTIEFPMRLFIPPLPHISTSAFFYLHENTTPSTTMPLSTSHFTTTPTSLPPSLVNDTTPSTQPVQLALAPPLRRRRSGRSLPPPINTIH